MNALQVALARSVKMGGKQRILVLDDEPLIAFDICDTLERAGFGIARSCTTTTQALAETDTHPPDFAFLDFALNGESAEAVADRLIELDCPFAWLTGMERKSLPARYKQQPCIEKPYRTEGYRCGRSALEFAHQAAYS